MRRATGQTLLANGVFESHLDMVKLPVPAGVVPRRLVSSVVVQHIGNEGRRRKCHLHERLKIRKIAALHHLYIDRRNPMREVIPPVRLSDYEGLCKPRVSAKEPVDPLLAQVHNLFGQLHLEADKTGQ